MAHLTKEIKSLKDLIDSGIISEEKRESFQKILDHFKPQKKIKKEIILKTDGTSYKRFSYDCFKYNSKLLLTKCYSNDLCFIYNVKNHKDIKVDEILYINRSNIFQKIILYMSFETLHKIHKLNYINDFVDLVRYIRANKDQIGQNNIKMAVYNGNLSIDDQYKVSIYDFPEDPISTSVPDEHAIENKCSMGLALLTLGLNEE